MTDTKLTEERVAFLRDKLMSWPEEMALTFGDVAALITLLDQHEPAPEEEREELVEWLDERLGLIYMHLPQLPECPGYWESMYEDEIEPLEKIRSLILSAPAPRKAVSRAAFESAKATYCITGPPATFILQEDIERFLYRLGLDVEPEGK